MRTTPNWPWLTPQLGIDGRATLRSAGGRLYAASQATGSIQVIDALRWRRLSSWPGGGGCGSAVDIAVVNARRAYISCANATHLLRLDPETGSTTNVVDLSVFADADGRPDLGWMTQHGGRLFVQIRRLDDIHGGFAPPGMLAVVDLATETLIDCDPQRPGIQAIELAGTYPKFKMQVVPQTRRLFVGATGGWMDAGGIEMVNLDTLRSEGLVIREIDDMTGADLGAFVMVSPTRGYLTFTTDLLLSSHLHAFDIATGMDPAELHTALNYFAPHMVYDPATGLLFVPDGGLAPTPGVHVFDAASGDRLTTIASPTNGDPVDLEMIRPALVAEASVSDVPFGP